MGRTKYKDKQIPCKDCGCMTTGYPKGENTASKWCKQCAASCDEDTQKKFQWSDAFDRFGFKDGIDECRTDEVSDFLGILGYKTVIHESPLYNTYIIAVTKKNRSVYKDPFVSVGYDNPRYYLPKGLVARLDNKFGRSLWRGRTEE